MAKRKAFLLRMDPRILDTLQRWADDELRSLNGQIEYLLRDAIRRSGRGGDDRDAPRGRSPDDTSDRSPDPDEGEGEGEGE